MNAIEEKWNEYNETQKAILLYLFRKGSAVLSDLLQYTKINQNSVRSYLNAFIAQNIIERHSGKQRDVNAKYTFKKE